MKTNKKGAFKALAAVAGGFVGGAVQNKIIPMIDKENKLNPWLKAGAPAALGFLGIFLIKKPGDLVEGGLLGMCGAGGNSLGSQAGIYGIMDSPDQILLSAFSPINAVNDTENMKYFLPGGVNAAADFNSSIMAAADFSSSIMSPDSGTDRF